METTDFIPPFPRPTTAKETAVTPPVRVEFPSMEAKSTVIASPEYIAAMGIKRALDASGLSWEHKAGVAMMVAVLIVGEAPNIKARRGKVINAVSEEMRQKLRAYLPL